MKNRFKWCTFMTRHITYHIRCFSPCAEYTKDTSYDKLKIDKMFLHILQIVREYDQEIPQSQIADNPMAPRGRAAQPSRDTMKTN